MKFSSIIISTLLIVLAMTAFFNFYSGVSDTYPVSMDAKTEAILANYTSGTNTINNDIISLNNTVFNVKPSFTDILGGFLAGGYNALKIAGKSLTTFNAMLENTQGALGIESYWLTIARIIVLVIAVFIVISVLVGRDV